MEDRLVGLDMEHCKIFLTKLAKFHAASAVRHEKFGPYDVKFMQNFFREETKDFFDVWMKSISTYLIEALEKDDFFTKYIEKLVNFFKSLIENIKYLNELIFF